MVNGEKKNGCIGVEEECDNVRNKTGEKMEIAKRMSRETCVCYV